MDREYLKQIAGSPYIEEGLYDRLLARTRSGTQMAQALSGNSLESPQITKLKSLWNVLLISLRRILTDVENQISPLIKYRQSGAVDPNTGKPLPPATQQQLQMLEAMKELYDAVTGNVAIGNTLQQVKNPSYNLKSMAAYQKGSQNAPSQPSPTSTKLSEIFNESMWDATRRIFTPGGISLSKAIASRDPDTILNAYKNAIKQIYDKFAADAVKLGIPASMLSTTVKRIYPARIYKDILEKIEKINNFEILGAKGSEEKSKPEEPKPEEPKPEEKDDDKSGGEKEGSSGKVSNVFSGGASVGAGGGLPGGNAKIRDPQISSLDMPYIIERAVEIVIDVVKADKARSKPFFDRPLPQSPLEKFSLRSSPSNVNPESNKLSEIIKENEQLYGYTKGKQKNRRKNPDSPIHNVPFEFLQNFRSAFRKSNTFSVEMVPYEASLSEPIYLPNSSKIMKKEIKIKMDIFWNCDNYVNRIQANFTNLNSKQKTTNTLMIFFDHEVSAQMGAQRDDSNDPENPTIGKFSVQKAVSKVNAEWMEKMPGDVDARIANMEDAFFRALYATVYRKSMEWKSGGEGTLDYQKMSNGSVRILKFKNDGSLDGPEQIFTIDQIKQILNGKNIKEKNRWIDILKYLKYTEEELGMPIPKPEDVPTKGTPEETENTPEILVFNDFVKHLIKLGYKEPNARSIASQLWLQLRDSGQQENKITIEDLIKLLPKKGESGTSPESEKRPPPKGKTPEQQLEKVNKSLQSVQLPPIKDVQAMYLFFSMKGGRQLKKKVDLAKENGKNPFEPNSEVWKEWEATINDANAGNRKPRRMKKNDVESDIALESPSDNKPVANEDYLYSIPIEEIINPYHFDNFL